MVFQSFLRRANCLAFSHTLHSIGTLSLPDSLSLRLHYYFCDYLAPLRLASTFAIALALLRLH